VFPIPEPITRTATSAAGPVVATQAWRDVAFLHWRVDAEHVAPLLPVGTRPDEFDGTSWVGLIAFSLEAATLGPALRFGGLGDFVEVNVRLYSIDREGRRGVVFRSLEASSLPAVIAARSLFSLPYRWSRTAMRSEPGVLRYRSKRIHGGERSAIDIEPDRSRTVDDPLAEFLTARWALHERQFGRTVRMMNEHEPWTLHPARALRVDDELVAAAGLPGIADRPPDSVLFSPGVHARFMPPVGLA
jgi:hypothetical protein